MDEKEIPEQVADDFVVSLEYTLKVEGKTVETTEGVEPVQFLQGYGNIIPGLERRIYGMKVGDTKKVTLSPSEGYGIHDKEAVTDVPRIEFPPEIPLEEGVEIAMHDEEEEDATVARITWVGADVIQLDFNHPLAGKDLEFEVKVVELRHATEDEIEHGHVHNLQDHDYEDEDEEEDFIFEDEEEGFEDDDLYDDEDDTFDDFDEDDLEEDDLELEELDDLETFDVEEDSVEGFGDEFNEEDLDDEFGDDLEEDDDFEYDFDDLDDFDDDDLYDDDDDYY